MKELSIEEKARRYDGAIKRLEDIETGKCQKTFMFTEGLFDYIFPELKESKDERIRKGIILNLEYLADRAEGFVKDELKERIAWLEKLKVFAEHGDGLYYFGNNGFTYVGNPTCDNVSRIERQVEQKPADWSEDDDKMYTATIFALAGFMGNEDKIDWLKSLKDRVQPQPQWKPSDEQMEALGDINLTGNISYAGQGQELINLYNDLKKLRE